YNITGFPINRAALDRKNIKPALLASGAVPLLMSGIRNIAGAPPGTYRDGGLIDYHLNIDLFENSRQERGIVLFPHYTEKIIPGWLDKHLLWKRTDFSALENTLMIAPSREFTRSLPCGKIPDRHDFYRFAGRDKQRMQYWQTVVERSRELAADFAEAVESGAIRSRLQPIKTRGGI
ncbi:MAG: patatin-like phospholipase family protein, partial [Desulfosalsimonas sp.]